MTTADARDTAARLRATAAGLRQKGQHADAEHLDDLADGIERNGIADGIEQSAAKLQAKGQPDKARKLRTVASSARGTPSGAPAAIAAGLVGLAFVFRGRR